MKVQSRFSISEICLNFLKRVSHLRNGRERIFATIFLPEFICDQSVRLAFSYFGDVVSAFKDRHKFDRDIRNGQRQI